MCVEHLFGMHTKEEPCTQLSNELTLFYWSSYEYWWNIFDTCISTKMANWNTPLNRRPPYDPEKFIHGSSLWCIQSAFTKVLAVSSYWMLQKNLIVGINTVYISSTSISVQAYWFGFQQGDLLKKINRNSAIFKTINNRFVFEKWREWELVNVSIYWLRCQSRSLGVDARNRTKKLRRKDSARDIWVKNE